MLRRADQAQRIAELGDDLIGHKRCGGDGLLPVSSMGKVWIDLPDGFWDVELWKLQAGIFEPMGAPAQDPPMHGGRPRLALCLSGARRRASAHRPIDVEVVEAAASTPGAALQALQRRGDNSRRIAHHQQRTVGDFTR
jgi:hypothetical protein